MLCQKESQAMEPITITEACITYSNIKGNHYNTKDSLRPGLFTIYVFTLYFKVHTVKTYKRLKFLPGSLKMSHNRISLKVLLNIMHGL